MKKWFNNPLTIVAIIALVLSLFVNVVQYQDAKELNAEWREAATLAFESRMFGGIETATPDTLSLALNPCAAFTWLERGRMKQMGCDRYGEPQGPVYVQVGFVSPQDAEFDSRIWWY